MTPGPSDDNELAIARIGDRTAAEGTLDLASIQDTVTAGMTPAVAFAAHLVQAQPLLLEFVREDLELAFTLLRAAEIAGEANHTEHRQAALARVQDAINAIRHLASRILNPQSRSGIDAKTEQLETALASFKNPGPASSKGAR